MIVENDEQCISFLGRLVVEQANIAHNGPLMMVIRSNFRIGTLYRPLRSYHHNIGCVSLHVCSASTIILICFLHPFVHRRSNMRPPCFVVRLTSCLNLISVDTTVARPTTETTLDLHVPDACQLPHNSGVCTTSWYLSSLGR